MNDVATEIITLSVGEAHSNLGSSKEKGLIEAEIRSILLFGFREENKRQCSN